MRLRLLYICTHNHCRSILAEAITRHLANSQIEVASAGSQPTGEVNANCLKFLSARGISTDNLHSKSWHEFEDFKPHAVITLCDQAATEACPSWFDAGVRAHWGLTDPAKTVGSDKQIRQAFITTIETLEYRINELLKLNLAILNAHELTKQLRLLAGRNNNDEN